MTESNRHNLFVTMAVASSIRFWTGGDQTAITVCPASSFDEQRGSSTSSDILLEFTRVMNPTEIQNTRALVHSVVMAIAGSLDSTQFKLVLNQPQLSAINQWNEARNQDSQQRFWHRPPPQSVPIGSTHEHWSVRISSARLVRLARLAAALST